MIPSQRHLFDLPEDIAYLNCAFTSPLLRPASLVGNSAIRAKEQPWGIKPDDFFTRTEDVRRLFGRLVGCDGDCVAVIPAVSYGIALAAKNLPIRKGETIVVLQDQFPSNIYSWQRLAASEQAEIKAVQRPSDGDWTRQLLSAIDEDTAIVAVANCHWTDGTLIDLSRIGEACRSVGAALVVDATQSLGAMPFSIEAVQPDFLVVTSHKWLLGPYSFGFCYVAPKWHQGIPLEENWLNRAGSENFARLVDYRDDYQAGARKFDMGAVSNFILTPIAAAALNQLLEWTVEDIAATLKAKTDAIAALAVQLGLKVAPAHARSPHMIGVTKPGGFRDDLLERLGNKNVFVSVRGESVRIAPHVYNTEEDIERLFSVLKSAM